MTLSELEFIADEEEFDVKSSPELIKHLSAEIDTYTRMMIDWRARAAFYWLVGPFVVIGSVVVVTKQLPMSDGLDRGGWIAAGIACVCFLVMAYIGARMEAHMTNQCNTWRFTILRLSSEGTGTLRKSDVVVKKQFVKTAYMIAHILLLAIFVCCVIILLRTKADNPNAASQDTKVSHPPNDPGSR